MIVRQFYIYSFYDRASHSYADCRLMDGKVDARTLATRISAYPQLTTI